jgi:hypothetical protein
VAVTLATLVGLFLGDALLVPVTEVGSMASASGWFAACLSFLLLETRIGSRVIAFAGCLVALLLAAMKLVPLFPGHFSRAEWIAFAAWLALGAAMHIARRKTFKETGETARV